MSERFTLLLVLAGCTGPATPKDTHQVDTASDSVAPADTDSGTDSADSDSGTPDSDTGSSADSDSATDTDSAADSGDTDSAEPIDTSPQTLDLESSADAKLIGENAYDAGLDANIEVAAAGDVDADGFDDVIVGLPNNPRGGYASAGSAYVVRGPFSGDIDLSAADAILVGTEPATLSGDAIASAGDANGDGYDDVVVNCAVDWVGAVCVINGPVTGERELSAADAVLMGTPADGIGVYLASAGDMNGDGYDDLLLSAHATGRVYVAAGPFSGEVDLPSEAVMTISEYSYYSIADGADIDGDGLSDILLQGSSGSTTQSCVLFYGPPAGAVLTSDADAHFLDTVDAYACRLSPQTAGDIDGDGYGDVIIDSVLGGDVSDYSGAAFVGLGPFYGDVDIPSLDAKLNGIADSENAGYAVDGAGDVNGDGFDDVLVGSPEGPMDGPGNATVLYGPVSGTISLADANWTFWGDGNDLAGQTVAGVGDVDGDGLADVLIGGPQDADGGTNAGAAWLVLGKTMWPY